MSLIKTNYKIYQMNQVKIKIFYIIIYLYNFKINKLG